MSQAPTGKNTSPTSQAAKEQKYAEGFVQINNMLRLGKSFSGNERNCFFLNTNGGKFANISAISGFDLPDDCRAIAKVDWDFDGDTDLWLTNRSGPNLRFLRNNFSSGNHFVSFWLEGDGKATNCDAIGARIQVILAANGGEKLVKTLRAGDGFQSQSSRWIKFGLGSHESIEKVVVRWPDGTRSEFAGIAPDSWYVLPYGVSAAEQWMPPATDLTDIRESPAVSSRSFSTRTILSKPIPFPPVRFETFEQKSQDLIEATRNRATLVVLWATWCPNCLHELGELEKYRSKLDESGIDVIAICVDVLGDERGATVEQARKILANSRISFVAGAATPRLMDLLHAVDEYIYDQPRSLPVPASFLFDDRGELSASYKGAVTPGQLLEDVAIISGSPQQRLAAAVPFHGIWSEPQADESNLMILVSMLASRGRTKAVEFYLRKLVDSKSLEFAACADYCQLLMSAGKIVEAVELCKAKVDEHPEHMELRMLFADMLLHNRQPLLAEQQLAKVLERQPQNATVLLSMGHSFLDRGNLVEAEKYFQRSVNANPDLIEAQIQLAKCWAFQGKTGKAMGALEATAKQHSERPEVFIALAEVHRQAENLSKAISNFETALDLDEKIAPVHFQLGRCLQQAGQREKAVTHYRRALELAPKNPLALNQWGVLQAEGGDLEEAMKYFQAALDVDPNFKPAVDNLLQARSFQQRNKSGKKN